MTAVADVLDYLRAVPLNVYDSFVPDAPTFPYVVVYTDDGTRTTDRLTSGPNRGDHLFRIISAGVNPAQVRAVRRRVKGLAGQRFGGYVMHHDAANQTVPDNDLPGAVLSGYDQFSLLVDL